MKACFITGTDTGVGKTVICGLLGKYLSDRGCSVITQKWIQTGNEGFPEDIATHLKLMGIRREDIRQYLSYVSPYIFKLPASPHLASEKKKKKIDRKKIEKSYRFLCKEFNSVIVEGAGGALVPYDRSCLMIDIAKNLSLPVIVVADNKLGAINHTLLTIEAVKKRGMKILGIIFNNTVKGEKKIIMDDNPKIVKEISREDILGILPHLKEEKALHNAFIPIGDKILRCIS